MRRLLPRHAVGKASLLGRKRLKMSYPFSNTAAESTETHRPKVASIREEARSAILAEQLAYLVNHRAECNGQCPDCFRLRTVEEVLLRPFSVDVYEDLTRSA
jgi:hypothetical protein